MKNKCLLFITLLAVMICSLDMSAQSRISSVYGVNLGDPESKVTSIVSGRWVNNPENEGGRYYAVQKPRLGSCTFDDAIFRFKDGKLILVTFRCTDSGILMKYGGGSDFYNQCIANSKIYKDMYNTMFFNLSNKYGNPVIDNGERALWKSNGNQLELEYVFWERDSWGNTEASTAIYVIYKVIDNSSSNY